MKGGSCVQCIILKKKLCTLDEKVTLTVRDLKFCLHYGNASVLVNGKNISFTVTCKFYKSFNDSII